MIDHIDLGRNPAERRKNTAKLIRSGSITLGGYKKRKIYGLLNCSSGKNMKIENRVFFSDEAEALVHGYRPCGHCMPEQYKQWRSKLPTQHFSLSKKNLAIPKSRFHKFRVASRATKKL